MEAKYYGVTTTRIYCRLSCGARRPRPENIRYFATVDDAESAGFRACKRCRPNEAARAEVAVQQACRFIAESLIRPALADIAQHVELSPYHFQRVFKAATGVSPRAYAEAIRNERVRDAIASGSPITEAIYNAGFNASSRFYANVTAITGMKPSQFRAQGRGERIEYATAPCQLGIVLVARTERGICAISFGESESNLLQELRRRFSLASIDASNSLSETISAVITLIDNPKSTANLPLDIQGTAFQRRVWEILRSIPAGTTMTYAQIAEKLGSRKSARAVGQACAANPIGVAIPCHRAVASNGDERGYRWGIDRKRTLLKNEAENGAGR